MKRIAYLGLFLLVGASMPMVLGTLSAGIVGAVLALWGVALAIFLFVWNSHMILRRCFGARVTDTFKSPELINLARLRAAQLDIPRPELAFYKTAQANAFILGQSSGRNSVIMLSEALLQELTRADADALLALLMIRLKRRETYTAQALASMGSMGSILLSGALFRKPGSPEVAAGAFSRFLVTIEAPILRLAEKILLTDFMKSEAIFEADRQAAQLLGGPLSLANALARLDRLAALAQNHTVERFPATAHMFVVDPLQGSHSGSWLKTHPPTSERIERLRQMAGLGSEFD